MFFAPNPISGQFFIFFPIPFPTMIIGTLSQRNLLDTKDLAIYNYISIAFYTY